MTHSKGSNEQPLSARVLTLPVKINATSFNGQSIESQDRPNLDKDFNTQNLKINSGALDIFIKENAEAVEERGRLMTLEEQCMKIIIHRIPHSLESFPELHIESSYSDSCSSESNGLSQFSLGDRYI